MSKTSSLLPKVHVNQEHAILLGSFVSCDGFEHTRKVGALTHVHDDHTKGFGSSLKLYEPILMSKPTRDLMIAIEGPHLRFYRNVMGVDMGTPFTYEDNAITLFPASHILGSSQILVQNGQGSRLVYTGDFYYPGTNPIQCDLLVVDSTYGSPLTPPAEDPAKLHSALNALVEHALKADSPVYILSRRGKLQQLMNLLRMAGIECPFIATDKDCKIASVYESYGRKIGDLIADQSPEAIGMIKSKDPYIGFYPIGKKIPESAEYLRIRVTKWAADQSVIQYSATSWQIALSDHADFAGTIEYIKACNPSLVITDERGGESETAEVLAWEIKRRLNIEALPFSKVPLETPEESEFETFAD